jgi:hypothetical protein
MIRSSGGTRASAAQYRRGAREASSALPVFRSIFEGLFQAGSGNISRDEKYEFKARGAFRVDCDSKAEVQLFGVMYECRLQP